MNLTASLAIYLVVWWIVIFVTLPFGTRSQYEEGGIEGQGRDPGAPVRIYLWRKMAVTTVVAGIIWLGIAYLVIDKPFSFSDIPFMPKFNDSY
ncbi:MAG: DUF1467 family protein [Parvibaculaceae bacterium]